MEEALELARAKDTKERMAGVEQLHQLLEASRKSLSSSEVSSLVDVCLDLLKDNNFRISQGGLQALTSAAVLSGEHLKLHFNALIPAIVERLGDAKQPVRDAARTLLLTLMEVSSPTIIVERAGNHAWSHKSWRVKEEFAHTVTTSINLYASTELPLQRAVLPHILQMLNDSNHGVREAAILCIEEMYTQIGPQFRDELQRHYLPISMAKDINSRLDKIEPNVHSSNGLATIKVKPAVINPKKSSPRNRSSPREGSLFGGDGDHTEKPVEPIKVYSEKELIREFEKIFSILVPEKDWSVRILAMQRVEALVIGGATEYPCFRGLLKQLIDPLSTQVSDRRSSIVKQACHLLCFLSKELSGDFEACAEMFIPVLFKLVVITVLVIAESADNCIKTILRNCKVVRSLPRIADSAKNDRSAILRARCCEYAILILEYWADAPEIKRSADLYEDLIKCCVADSMSEVRSTARACFKVFAKTWPDRSRRLLMSFDPVIQRVINEEDGGIHRRHVSISERGPHMTSSSPSKLSSYTSSPIIAMDRTASLPSPKSHSSGLFSSVTKSSERSLESVLHSSKEKVSAIESMLRGLNISEKTRSASLDLGADRPSSRDPLFPASTSDTTPKRNSGLKLSDIITQIQASKDSSNKSSYRSNIGSESATSASSSYSRKNIPNPYLGTPYKDNTNHNNYVPNFQRPLIRKNVPARVSTNRRRSFEDNHVSYTDLSSHVQGPGSLNDALSHGLSSSSDWNTRVASFNYLQSLLQQGSRGVHEITQSFEKIMKLFFQHLDDPHHKVAQAALSTLAELIPVCKKPFESYMERILPHVFSRLIDPKELVRQPCTKTLEIIAKTYSVDSQLPALLRSLDEQRSPKAKLAVIEFAITSLNKHLSNSEGSNNVGILKLWLAKLTSSVHDKNTKLKEASIMCIIAVYTHYDPTTVLNFILSLSVEEQNSLRRALKQYTPRIEVDLMNFIQNKKDKQRLKSSYDLSSNAGTSSEEGYIGVSKKTHFSSDRKWSSQSLNSFTHQTSNETREQLYSSFDNGLNTDILSSKAYDLTHGFDNMEVDNDELLYDSPLKANSPQETGLSIPQILHIIGNGSDGNPEADKHGALKQLIEISIANDQFIWSKYFNQILTAVLEVLDDTDSSIRELDLSFICELLKNQKDAMEDSVELVIEKLLHVTKDIVPNVSNEAEHCLTLVLSQYNPFRCLSVIVPLLQIEDEKTLVTCINCLTKLVERLSQEELMAQLPSFLPALFDAFGNQSTDVRKSVVFCLVDIYIMLGKTFLPYLEGLNSTQLRLVTIYANRISQSRTGTPIDATHD